MTLFRAGAFASPLLFLALLCTRCTSRPAGGSDDAPAAVARFLAQLDSIQALPTDTAQAEALQALYNNASPEVRQATCAPLLKVASGLLFYHADATPLLLHFYRARVADPVLKPVQRAQAAQHLASFYAHITGEPDSAAIYLAQATADTAVLTDTLRAKIAATQAQIYQLKGALPEATASLYGGIRSAEKSGDFGLVAQLDANLANVYRATEDFRPAIRHRSKALVYFISQRDTAHAFVAATGLAADYTDLKQADSARHYIRLSETLRQTGVQNPLAEYLLDLSAGGLYVTLKKYDSAIFWFNRAKVLLPQLRSPVQEQYFTVTSAMAYAFRRDVMPEVGLIRGYIPGMLADSNIQAARDAYYSLYLIATQQPAAGSALDYYQVYDSLRSVLADDRNRSYAAEMAAHYGAEKRDLTIRLQEREIKQKSALNGLLVVSVLCILLAGVAALIRYRLHDSRRKVKWQERFTSEMLKYTEAERGRIAMDLHDGVGHELLTLKNSLDQPLADNEARVDTILNNIRRMSRALHPVMLDTIGLEHSIYSLCEQVTASGHLFVSAEIEYNKQLTPECELQLYRIIQESLSNAVKYAEAHAAKVSIREEGRQLLVTIMDNGKGFDVDDALASDASFGLHSILERSKVLGGTAEFESGRQGTTLSIEIPLS